MKMFVRPTLYPFIISLSILFTMLLAGVSHPFLYALATTYFLIGVYNIPKPGLDIDLTPREEIYDEREDYDEF